jgi:hypothetical protein
MDMATSSFVSHFASKTKQRESTKAAAIASEAANSQNFDPGIPPVELSVTGGNFRFDQTQTHIRYSSFYGLHRQSHLSRPQNLAVKPGRIALSDDGGGRISTWCPTGRTPKP